MQSVAKIRARKISSIIDKTVNRHTMEWANKLVNVLNFTQRADLLLSTGDDGNPLSDDLVELNEVVASLKIWVYVRWYLGHM